MANTERRSAQAPSAVIMIRPHQFWPNEETANDNAFQLNTNIDRDTVAKSAFDEVSRAAQRLEEHGIKTHIFEDESGYSPDSVFPNNWFSTHPGGHVALYPMYAMSRRKERRYDIIEMLKHQYRVQDVIDYSGLELDDVYLEGTGAMVLDHIDRVAYAVKSNRTDPIALERFCTHFNYEPMVFDAFDRTGTAVYHTNVLMCIATDFVLICPTMIANDNRRSQILERMLESGREIIALDESQIENFAGNAIELQGRDGRLLVLSKRAYDSLTAQQLSAIERSASVLALDVPSIELAGGSIRCMIAGVHLSPR